MVVTNTLVLIHNVVVKLKAMKLLFFSACGNP